MGTILSPGEVSVGAIHTKNIYDLTIAIINKCLEFQIDWFKIIRTGCHCTHFRPVSLC